MAEWKGMSEAEELERIRGSKQKEGKKGLLLGLPILPSSRHAWQKRKRVAGKGGTVPQSSVFVVEACLAEAQSSRKHHCVEQKMISLMFADNRVGSKFTWSNHSHRSTSLKLSDSRSGTTPPPRPEAFAELRPAFDTGKAETGICIDEGRLGRADGRRVQERGCGVVARKK